MKSLNPSLWRVTYFDANNKKIDSAEVYALNRRFALWNAIDFLGFPQGKVTASKQKKKGSV